MENPLNDLTCLSNSELYDQAIERARQAGNALSKITGKFRAPKDVAIYRSLCEASERIKQEFYARWNISQSPTITNTRAFQYLAMHRKRGRCEICESWPWNGRTLEFWARANAFEPTLLIEAWKGTNSEKLKFLKPSCQLLCHRCATRSGGTLLRSGRPDLSAYGIDDGTRPEDKARHAAAVAARRVAKEVAYALKADAKSRPGVDFSKHPSKVSNGATIWK